MGGRIVCITGAHATCTCRHTTFTCIAGAHSDGKGNYIDIFSTEDPDASKWKKVKTLEGHTSFVTGLDWDVDGSIIKSTNGNPELLYHDTKGDKNSIPSGATSFSDTEWATFSTIVGWPVQGEAPSLG